MSQTKQPLLAIHRLTKEYRVKGGLFARTVPLRAVNEVSFSVMRGECVGLVGESGSGKTTLARCILRLTSATSGTVEFDEVDVFSLGAKALRSLRRRMQIVFQDPYGSLNPRMTVGTAVREPLEVHGIARGEKARARVRELFGEVGLDPSYLDRYPHELSGGQRQRVGIARALSVEPEFLVLDEPVAALDASVQAQVLNLLMDLRERRHLTYLFIAHDLAVVRHIANRMLVMYLGKLMEIAAAASVYEEPLHPYTSSLLSAIPVPDPTVDRDRIVLAGDMPSPRNPPAGCVFHPRCPHPAKSSKCEVDIPALREVRPAHWAACHYAERTKEIVHTGYVDR